MTASGADRSRWDLPFLVGALVLGGLLLSSWFFGPTRSAWHAVDRAVFSFTDWSLGWGEPWRIFWAALNSKAFDMASALFFLVLYLVFVARSGRANAARNLACGAVIALYTSLVITLSSHYVFTFERLSPTWVVEGARRLSEMVPWIPHKDWSGRSFPGDHGIAALMFSFLLWHVAGRGFGLVSLGVSVFFVLPRLFSGAHWLSDVAAGSVAVSSIALAALLGTPLWPLAVRAAEKPIAAALRVLGLGARSATADEAPGSR